MTSNTQEVFARSNFVERIKVAPYEARGDVVGPAHWQDQTASVGRQLFEIRRFTLLGTITSAAVLLLVLTSIMDTAEAGSPSSAAPASAAATPSASAGGSSSAAIEAQMLAFQGVDKIAANIASMICEKKLGESATIMIYDQGSFASLPAFEAFATNIKVLTAAYKTLIPDLKWLSERLGSLSASRRKSDSTAVDAKAMPPEFADHLNAQRERLNFAFTATGDPFSDFTSLLSAIAVSANVETPNSVTIPDSSIAISLTSLLTADKPCDGYEHAFRVIYPPLFGRGSTSDYSLADIDLDIQILEDIRQAAHEITLKTLKEYGKGSDESALLTKTATDIDGLYDSFINSLVQVNSSTGLMGSAAVIQGYRLANILKDPSTHVLLATVVGAGGTEHDHKTFWTALGPGDELTYSGGLIVNVALWKGAEGSPESSKVMEYKSAFVNADGRVGN